MPNFRLLIKHQTGAALSTAVDFGFMSLLVEYAKFQPELATAIGAFCGALTNFVLGRSWIFSAAEGHSKFGTKLGSQLARYAIVSVVSLAWNTLGEALLYRGLGLQYFVARVFVAVFVSVAWNYPMHRWFVFRSSDGQLAA
jgi:putative flippase GtrA